MRTKRQKNDVVKQERGFGVEAVKDAVTTKKELMIEDTAGCLNSPWIRWALRVRGLNMLSVAEQMHSTLLSHTSMTVKQRKCWAVLRKKFDRFVQNYSFSIYTRIDHDVNNTRKKLFKVHFTWWVYVSNFAFSELFTPWGLNNAQSINTREHTKHIAWNTKTSGGLYTDHTCPDLIKWISV